MNSRTLIGGGDLELVLTLALVVERRADAETPAARLHRQLGGVARRHDRVGDRLAVAAVQVRGRHLQAHILTTDVTESTVAAQLLQDHRNQ